jgi:hypothetical protein
MAGNHITWQVTRQEAAAKKDNTVLKDRAFCGIFCTRVVMGSKFKNSKVARTAPTNFEPLNFEL